MRLRLALTVLTAAACIVLTVTSAQGTPPVTESGEPFIWEEDGARVFGTFCASCHMANGVGIPGVFPPLSGGHLHDLIGREGGREVLLGTILYGLAGEISVDGTVYNGAMPSWAHLSDEEIAAVLNHVLTAWSEADTDVPLFGPGDVAEARGLDLAPADVLAQRAAALGDEVSGDVASSDAPMIDDATGYYQLTQAERGEEAYMQHCAECHGNTMRGGLHSPPLSQLGFFRTWDGRTFDTFYSYLSTRMPINNPGRLSTSTYVEIAAYWLATHNYPAGEVALTSDPDQLRQILIERR